MNGAKKLVWFFVAALFLVVTGAGLLIYWIPLKATPDPEIMMGILVIFSIATLMTVLFILAAGFTSMSLADPKQALGLPEGSIRAMIALVLIMVFIIFGIFLFRKVGQPDKSYLGREIDKVDVIPDGTKTSFLFEKIRKVDKENSKGEVTDENNYYVYAVAETSEEGKRLAQQLIAKVGTLVVAIASFYFGTTMESSAAKKEREGISAVPVIKDTTPGKGGKGQTA
jgi:hypothetical protein